VNLFFPLVLERFFLWRLPHFPPTRFSRCCPLPPPPSISNWHSLFRSTPYIGSFHRFKRFHFLPSLLTQSTPPWAHIDYSLRPPTSFFPFFTQIFVTNLSLPLRCFFSFLFFFLLQYGSLGPSVAGVSFYHLFDFPRFLGFETPLKLVQPPK